MKYFLVVLILLTSSVFAGKRMQMRQSEKEVVEINSIRSKKVALCNSFSSATDKQTCGDSIELIIKARLETMLGGYISDHINKASDDLRLEIKEEKCVERMQSEFDNCGWSYNRSETCKQLIVARKANGICTPDGLGSGSGS